MFFTPLSQSVGDLVSHSFKAWERVGIDAGLLLSLGGRGIEFQEFSKPRHGETLMEILSFQHTWTQHMHMQNKQISHQVIAKKPFPKNESLLEQ